MHLKPYLEALPRGGLATLSGVLGISSVYLMQLSARQGGREPSPELCVRIENATYRQVRRWDLRPTDWHLIWPELVGADGAPNVPEGAKAGA
jgi:DNA-binding transcriptional regulator YdaS (Cro superfamily)